MLTGNPLSAFASHSTCEKHNRSSQEDYGGPFFATQHWNLAPPMGFYARKTI
jgi:hypothetical protein